MRSEYGFQSQKQILPTKEKPVTKKKVEPAQSRLGQRPGAATMPKPSDPPRKVYGQD